ncbi:MAG TPA: hypothetical protein VHH34_05300, partial [Pseudonocardiaceae bacterium]|nr:hypothetical protein [Pseudonocardiaceae bacterium]
MFTLKMTHRLLGARLGLLGGIQAYLQVDRQPPELLARPVEARAGVLDAPGRGFHRLFGVFCC